VDGGIRSGLDVLKAVGIGAQATLIGRPWAYALAAGGQQAVEHMLSIIKDELRIGMALTGHSRMTDIDQSIFAD
jgi:L-lactate dehydrogenase (cytochrome)